MNIPSFLEDRISQVPALQVLMNLGWEYVMPEEAFRLRGGKYANVILEEVLEQQLRKINTISFKGKDYKFSNANISNAIGAIKNIPYDGLVNTNEKIYDNLCLGKSFEETIAGETKSFTLKYIDWENIGNNKFQVTAEFPVERTGAHETGRPDIVLFVNGLPLGVIECKRPDIKHPAAQAVSQNIGNQRDDRIPALFVFAQILLALSPNEAKYATAGTPSKFWSEWKESGIDKAVREIVNKPLNEEEKKSLFSGVFARCRDYFRSIEAQGDREPREQDRVLYCLCKPDRFLELMRQFIVFDGCEKKITRYQQYFAVKNTLQRVLTFDEDKLKRSGGVIWHTQGSGKSITMVMLAKALVLCSKIVNPRIVVVTDRIDLDVQIHETFHSCGKEPVKARTGRHLIELIESGKEAIITTVIDKFKSAVKTKK